MAFATRTLDFANVDALLKAAELLEGTLNRGFGGGVEKADSDLGLSMDIFAHKHEPTLTNPHPNGGKTDCLSKRTQKNHSVVVHPSRQDILRMKADNTSPDFWAKSPTAIERLGRTLSVSGYHFVKSDTELPLHSVGESWIDQSARVDKSRSSSFGVLISPNQNRIFTAASGLGHDLRPSVNPSNPLEEDQEGSSNTSEVEDSCLDNSSQDSFTGHHGLHALPNDTVSRRLIDPSTFSCDRTSVPPVSVSSPPSSHCRLRTALLNSPGRLNTTPNKNLATCRLPTNQSFPSSGRTLVSPPEINRSLVISKRTDHNDKPVMSKDVIPKIPRIGTVSSRGTVTKLTEVHRSSSSHILSALDSVGTNLPLCANRPPSATPTLRRMSSDSCVERTFALHKSVSQPHSPEYQHRRASMPISPCRLPMKKRKFDWDQVISEEHNKRAMFAPYTSTERNHFPLNGVNSAGMTKKTVGMGDPVSNDGLTVPSPLVIDCPLDGVASPSDDLHASMKKPLVPLSAPPSVRPFTRDTYNVTDDEDSMDHRPRSIPSSLNTCAPLNPVEQVSTISDEKSHNPVENLFTECALQNTLDKLAAVLSGQSPECLQYLPSVLSNPFDNTKGLDYSQLSSLVRTLTSSSLSLKPVDAVPVVSHPQKVPSTLLSDVNNKQSSELSSDGEIHWGLGRNKDMVIRREPQDSEAARLETGESNVAQSVNNSATNNRFGLARPSYLIQPHAGTELDTEFDSGRTATFNRLIQSNECLSNSTEKTTTRHPFRMKKWLTATEPSSRRLVTELSTVAPNSLTIRATDVGPLSCSGTQTTQSRIELTTKGGVTLHRSQSEPCSQTMIMNGEATWSCQPPPTKPTASSVTDPGAQILMMLSPSEQDKSILPTLDPSFVHALQTGLSGTSKKFPLLLVSASSSASAAALAAAAAMASGAPPTSLVPVPVQVRTYTSSEANGVDRERGTDSTQPTRYGMNCQNSEDTFSMGTHQRLVLSFCPPENECTSMPLDRRLPLILSTSSPGLPNDAENNQHNFRAKANVNSDLSLKPDTTRFPLLQSTAFAHSS